MFILFLGDVVLQLDIVLASGSPRRRQLLSRMGLEYSVVVPEVDEEVAGRAQDVVMELCKRKARAVAQMEAYRNKPALIIAADTLVEIDGEVLGKPKSEEHAYITLRKLSGNEHRVLTGVCLLQPIFKKEHAFLERTAVVFNQLSDEQIRAYISTGEPMDKAGAYGIQGAGGAFVQKIEGSFENVMGLPVQRLAEELRQFGFDIE